MKRILLLLLLSPQLSNAQSYDSVSVMSYVYKESPSLINSSKYLNSGIHLWSIENVKMSLKTDNDRFVAHLLKNRLSLKINDHLYQSRQLKLDLLDQYMNSTQSKMSPRKYKMNFRKFAKGKKHRLPYAPDLWDISFSKEPFPNQPGAELSLLRKNSITGNISWDSVAILPESVETFANYIPHYLPNQLPIPDYSNCVPLNILDMFRVCYGPRYHFNEKNSYKPEISPIKHRTYSTLFEKNSSLAHSEDISAIAKVLSDSSYQISHVWIEAYASVEGDSLVNHRLMNERARQFVSILESYQQDSILLDSIIVKEQWDMFFSQVRNTSYHYIQELDKDSIRSLLRNDSIEFSLSNYLNKQRYATLHLYYKRVWKKQEIPQALQEKFAYDLDRLTQIYPHKFYSEKIIKYTNYLSRMHYFALQQAKSGNPVYIRIWDDSTKSQDLFGLRAFPAYLSMHKFMEKNGTGIDGSAKLTALGTRAYYSLINAYLSYDWAKCRWKNILPREYFMHIANDFLIDMLNSISEGFIDKSIISILTIPEGNDFLKPRIIQAYFAELLYVPIGGDSVQNLFSYPNFSALTKNYQSNCGYNKYFSFPVLAMDNSIVFAQNLFYLSLKETVVKKGFDKPRLVSSLDQRIYCEYLMRNLFLWNPRTNYYFDQDNDMEKMGKMLHHLKRNNSIFCRAFMDRLTIDYHLKCIWAHTFNKSYAYTPFDKDAYDVVKSLEAIAGIYKYYHAQQSLAPVLQHRLNNLILYVYQLTNEQRIIKFIYKDNDRSIISRSAF